MSILQSSDRDSLVIEKTGEGDLAPFRELVFLYCKSLREKLPFRLEGSAEALELASWLGLSWDPEAEPGQTLALSRELPEMSQLPKCSLLEYRHRGYLGQTLFACLLRSSYGGDEEGFFPTSSEMGFYFDEALIREGQARWDDGYLEECQLFFFEELTPQELLESALRELPSWAGDGAERFPDETLGLAFLIGESCSNLRPLADFLERLFHPEKSIPGLRVVSSIQVWERDAVENLLQDESVVALTSGLPELSADILFACGPELLTWRAGI